MVGIGQGAARLFAAIILLSAAWAPASAQNGPQDGIDRNLLERQQRAAEFHVRLYDNARSTEQAATTPLPPVPHSFVGRELSDVPVAPPAAAVPAQPPGVSATQQLDDSQLRRQLELQTQNRFQDEPTRQQQSQIQQLQFGRENQAQQLQQQIRRDSDSMMQRTH
jgi:hypothetical protein